MCIPLCHALGPPSPLCGPHRCGVLQETHTAGPSTSVIMSACPHPLRTLQSGLASGTEYSTCPKAPVLGGDGGAAAGEGRGARGGNPRGRGARGKK